MAVKYHCKKCGKRFMDWGAEKLGFKCPDDGEELVRAGMSDEKVSKKPTLKRRVKKVVPAVSLDDEELLAEDVEGIEEVVDEEDEEEVILLEETAVSEGDEETFSLEDEVVADADDEDAELEVGEEESFDEAPTDEPIEDIGDWKA